MQQDWKSPETLNALLALKGEVAWWVRRGIDRVLTVEFGLPHLHVVEPFPVESSASQAVRDAVGRRIVRPTGRWHLFVSEAEWSVDTRSHACRRSDSDDEKIDRTLSQLDGQRLVEVSQTDGRSWRFSFNLGGSLDLTPPDQLVESRGDDDSLWTLFHHDGTYASYTNAGLLRDNDDSRARWPDAERVRPDWS